MNNKRMDIGGVVAGILELLVGILLLMNPVGFTNGIIMAAGAVLCLIGVKCIVDYFRMTADQAAKSRALLKGLCCLLVGVFCVFKSNWFAATFPVLTVLYGAVILLLGLGKIQITVDRIRLKRRRWFLAAISAVVTLVCAAVVLMNPFATTAVLWKFTGVTLIVEAVLDIVVAIFGRSGDNGYDKED